MFYVLFVVSMDAYSCLFKFNIGLFRVIVCSFLVVLIVCIDIGFSFF